MHTVVYHYVRIHAVDGQSDLATFSFLFREYCGVYTELGVGLTEQLL